MKHYIAALVENKAGVLARISGLFARRGFNINSLAVGETNDPAVSRVTIVVDGNDYISDQVTKQLSKLIDVRTVKLLDPDNMIQRDLVLVKVKIEKGRQGELDGIIRTMGCEIVDATDTSLIIEFDECSAEVDRFIGMLSEYEILEIVQTGAIALQKGEGTVYDEEE